LPFGPHLASIIEVGKLVYNSRWINGFSLALLPVALYADQL